LNRPSNIYAAKKMARRKDPYTSHAAAHKAVGSVSSQHSQILDLMQDRKPRSTEEIEITLGYDIHRRISELHENQMIQQHSETRNANGYKAMRYEITTKGIHQNG